MRDESAFASTAKIMLFCGPDKTCKFVGPFESKCHPNSGMSRSWAMGLVAEHSPEKEAVKYITTNKLKPKARAMLSRAEVLLRKHDPGTTARKLTRQASVRDPHGQRLVRNLQNPILAQIRFKARHFRRSPLVRPVSPPFPDASATSLV